MQQSVVIPSGILSTCHGFRRRARSTDARAWYDTTDQTHHSSGRRAVSLVDARTPGPTQSAAPSEQDSSPSHRDSTGPENLNPKESEEPHDHSTPTKQQSVPAVVDFGQSVENETKREDEGFEPVTICSTVPVFQQEQIKKEEPDEQSPGIFGRLSHAARNIVRPSGQRPSLSNDSLSARSIVSINDETNLENDSASISSRILRRLSYVARSVGGHASAWPGSQSTNRPSDDSYDFEAYLGRRQVIPKSWRFLGIENPGIGDMVSSVTHKLHRSQIREMYTKAKARQKQMKRSRTAQGVFRYTFYLLVVACVYLVLIGLPLWRGAVWYMYILFQKYMVLKAGLTITFGLGFLYAYTPLLINFERTAPLPEVDESGRGVRTHDDTALIIPCYKSEQLISHTLEAALKIFPKENIF
ncbi:MAG: hypothetical protein Q9224_004626, partial [Gallowayella concinna]